MATVKQFVLGKDKIPVWFNDECLKGRAKIEYDEGEIVDVIVYAPTGKMVARPGDVIMQVKAGMAVIPDKKAVKYGVKQAKSVVEKEADAVEEETEE